jgi:hypothetical protein
MCKKKKKRKEEHIYTLFTRNLITFYTPSSVIESISPLFIITNLCSLPNYNTITQTFAFIFFIWASKPHESIFNKKN